MKEPFVIKSNDLKESDFGSTITADILKTKTFSLARVRKVNDDAKLGYDKLSDVAYYVLDGEGYATVNGKRLPLKKGDCIFYPKGTKYKHSKGLALLAIASPPFDRSKRAYVERQQL